MTARAFGKRKRTRLPDYMIGSYLLLDPDFDDGGEDAVALLCHEIDAHGACPLHPDGNRITTYDPVPLAGDDGRGRPEQKPKPPRARPGRRRLPQERPPANDEFVAWLEERLPPPWLVVASDRLLPALPPGFPWLVGEDQRITQGQVVAFWRARQKRETWQHWAYSPIDRNPKHDWA